MAYGNWLLAIGHLTIRPYNYRTILSAHGLWLIANRNLMIKLPNFNESLLITINCYLFFPNYWLPDTDYGFLSRPTIQSSTADVDRRLHPE
jgi:hypothetical protein